MEKAGASEIKWLIVVIVLSDVILKGISNVGSDYGTGAYIPVVISAIVCAVVLMLTNSFFAHKDFHKVLSSIYGIKPAGFICLSLAVFTLMYASLIMGEYALAIKKFMLPATSEIFILAMMSAALLAVCLTGYEAICRYSSVAAWVFLGFVSVIIFLSLTEAKTENIYPLLGKGNFKVSLQPFGMFSFVGYYYVISSKAAGRHKATAFKSLAISFSIIIVLVVIWTLCVPYPLSAKISYPLHRLSLLANNSIIFQRLDGLVFIIWIFSAFISSGALMLIAATVFSEVLGLKNQNAVSPAIVFLAFLLSASGFGFLAFSRTFICLFFLVFMPVSAVICRLKGDGKS